MGCDDYWAPDPPKPSELNPSGDELTDRLMDYLKATGICRYTSEAASLAEVLHWYVGAKIAQLK